MTTVTIAEVNEWGVKPEGGGWADYSQKYAGPRPLVAGATYEVDIQLWKSKDGTKEKWYINSAKPAGASHAPPPPPTALPPTVDVVQAAPTMSPETLPAAQETARREGEAIRASLPPVERDGTRVSIERQVCLKAAAELWNGVEGWSVDEVKATAAKFYDWVSDTSVPPSEAEPKLHYRAAVDGAPPLEYQE